MKNTFLLLAILSAAACEVHNEVTVDVKQKAVVCFKYDYDNGTNNHRLEEVHSARIFIFDQEGNLYRDTLLTREAILNPEGAMHTYISNGHYTFISWANIGNNTEVDAERFPSADLRISEFGADALYYGKTNTPVNKGDSLIFDVPLFKSVFKVNVTVEGINYLDNPRDHYFGLMNFYRFDFNNNPKGRMVRYTPRLTYSEDGAELHGSFYTPYFGTNDDLSVGFYSSNPNDLYDTLAETTIRDFSRFTAQEIGHDVEITVTIKIHRAGATIIVSDWNGQIIQTEDLGN